MNYLIYGLIDPKKPDHIRYIGQTTKTLNKRIKRHISDTMLHSREDGRKLTYKENWILSLVNQGITPEIILLEEVQSTEELDLAEQFLIEHYRSLDQCECNFKDGGAFSVRNLKEMWATRNKEMGLMTTDEKKTALLAMPDNSPRPAKKENMGLGDYTTPSKYAYDAEFDKCIRAKFPNWFNSERVIKKKNDLLSLPAGSARPEDFPVDYTNKSKTTYDALFDEKIKSKFPHWFGRINVREQKNYREAARKQSESSDRKKAELLALPDDAARPHMKTPLGSSLCDYTSSPKSGFDPEFNQAIRKKFPHWFKEDRVAANMQALLDMPVGSPKPRKDCALGNMLRNYTKVGGKSYRADFHQAIQEKHPNWFAGKWYAKESAES